MFKTVSSVFLSCCMAVVSIGCGGNGQMSTAPVSGKVTFDGKPVTEGELQFIPQGAGNGQPGKPGAAQIQPDGTFTVSTYLEGDGAVVGKHTVEYIAPPPRPQGGTEIPKHSGEPSTEGEPVRSLFEGLVVQQNTAEIKSGENSLDINLMK